MTDWGIEAKGIAADAYSAICIDTAGLAHCYGDYPRKNDFLYFLQTNCESAHREPETCTQGNPLEWNRNAEAIRVYKVNGTPTGENTFSLKDWKSGSGGSWENWYAIGGMLYKSVGLAIDCTEPTGIEPGLTEPEILVYPNPGTGGCFHLEFPDGRINKVTILDVNGRIVKTIEGRSMDHEIIDGSGLPSGLYLLLVETGTYPRYLKIILL